MYRRSKFVEILLEIRQEMAHDADYDVELFTEMVRSGQISAIGGARKKLHDPKPAQTNPEEEILVDRPSPKIRK